MASVFRVCHVVSGITTNDLPAPYVAAIMSSILDETMVRPSDDSPFAYGERTVLQMQSQPFEVSEAVSAEDTIARLERKLDLAIAQIERLQHRIESIDLTLVRVLSR